MKKKYGILKVLMGLLLLVVIATYFIKGRSGNISYLALADVFFNFVQSFYYFFDTALFILVVGGFYGLLNRIPAYKKLVRSIALKFDEKSKAFVIAMTIVFALVSSFTGLNLIMLLFVPFVVSIILLLGYDKLVALSVTIGGSLVGFIGGIFVTFKDSSSQYGASYVNFAKMVGLDKMWNTSTFLPQCLLLVIGVVLLILYILSHIKNLEKKDVYRLSKSDAFFVEQKDRTGKKVVSDDEDVKVWPLIVSLCVLVVLLILGYLPWKDLFNINVFNDFHTWLTKLSIGKYTVFSNLISSQIPALGSWYNMGSYMMVIFMLCLFGLILKLVYRVKFEEAMDGFVFGVKKMLIPAILAMLAYCVLVSSYNNGFVETIITNAGKSFGDNVVIHSLISILGSVLNVDLYYVTSGVFSAIVSSLSDKANLSVYAVMFQSLYGVVQIVGPTSIILICGLGYLEVPYKTWLKYIWRFVVEILIAIFILLMVVSLFPPIS